MSRKVASCKTGDYQTTYIEYFFSACFLNSYLTMFQSIQCELKRQTVFCEIFSKIHPANIRLDEDVLKTSWRRLSSSSSEVIFKTSSRCLDQDEYNRLTHTSSEDVLKTSWRRLEQDQHNRLGHTSSRRLQGVLSRRLQNVFKTSCKNVFNTSSRLIQDVLKTSSRCFQDVSSS